MHRQLRRGGLAILVSAMFLLGADAGRAFRTGKQAADRGDAFAAAVAFVQALEADPKHKKAAKALSTVSSTGYAEKLDEAQAAEADGAHATAWRAYVDLDRLVRGLKKVGALSFGTIDVRAKIAETAQAAAEDDYAVAEAALGRREYDEAIARYRSAAGFVKGFRDTTAKIQTAFYRWADADIAAHRYRDAVEHYVASWKEGSTSDAQARASVVQVALGTYLIERGGCRQAVADARLAVEIDPTPAARELLARATDCARVRLALAGLENATGTAPAWVSVPDVLADQLLADTRQSASEFVELVDPDRLTSLLVDQGLFAYVGKVPPRSVQGVDHVVLGRIQELAVAQRGPIARVASKTAVQPYACTTTAADGSQVASRCERDVTVVFDLVQGTSSAGLGLSLKVVDVHSGVQVGVDTLRASREAQVYAARRPRLEDGTEVLVDSSGADGTVWNAELASLLRASTDLTPQDVLLREVIDDVARQAAQRVVRWVDAPPQVPDPPTLALAFP